MRTFVVCAALSSTAFCLYGAASRLAEDAPTVHEWGTFTSVAGPDGDPVNWNALGCGSDLPHFVNVVGFKFAQPHTLRMETPVLYFYSSHDLDASVNVSFPHGTITEFYPNAASQGQGIEWKSIKVTPGAQPDFTIEPAPSRYYAARATDAAPLEVGAQHEKFLFYRGVADIPVPLSARIANDGRVTVTNTGKDAVPVVMLFENRGGAVGYRNAGSIDRVLTLERPVLQAFTSEIKADLEGALIAQGLYPKEAAAMIDTWRDSWFEEGSRLIYILPQSAVDAMVPLQIKPAPASISRVFVGRIELITPETKRAVSEAAATHDAATLALYQRFLQPIGRSVAKVVNLPCQAAGGSSPTSRCVASFAAPAAGVLAMIKRHGSGKTRFELPCHPRRMSQGSGYRRSPLRIGGYPPSESLVDSKTWFR
jgi:hypothetical protein